MADIITNFVTVLLGSGAAIAITRLIFDYRREKRKAEDAGQLKFLQAPGVAMRNWKLLKPQPAISS